MALLTVEVCAGTSCHLLGNQAIIEALESLPVLGKNRSGLVTAVVWGLWPGPCVTIGKQVIEQASPEKVLTVIKRTVNSGESGERGGLDERIIGGYSN